MLRIETSATAVIFSRFGFIKFLLCVFYYKYILDYFFFYHTYSRALDVNFELLEAVPCTILKRITMYIFFFGTKESVFWHVWLLPKREFPWGKLYLPPQLFFFCCILYAPRCHSNHRRDARLLPARFRNLKELFEYGISCRVYDYYSRTFEVRRSRIPVITIVSSHIVNIGISLSTCR